MDLYAALTCYRSLRGQYTLRYPTATSQGQPIATFDNISPAKACDYATRIADSLLNDRLIGVFDDAGEMIFGVQRSPG